jgi:hypothetical protein
LAAKSIQRAPPGNTKNSASVKLLPHRFPLQVILLIVYNRVGNVKIRLYIEPELHGLFMQVAINPLTFYIHSVLHETIADFAVTACAFEQL